MANGADGVQIAAIRRPSLESYEGMRLSDVARLWEVDPVDALLELLLADDASTSAIFFLTSEEDVTCGKSDGARQVHFVVVWILPPERLQHVDGRRGASGARENSRQHERIGAGLAKSVEVLLHDIERPRVVTAP